MNRRELMLLLGGALTAPRTLDAQQKAMPVIGVLGATTPQIPGVAANLAAFRQGLGETGYVEGKNVAIEYRWAERHPERLPGLAADLVGLNVDVIVTEGGDAASWPRRTRRRQSRSCSTGGAIRFRLGWSPAWPGRAATSRVSTRWVAN
jgi:hypothetical protein